MSVSQRSEERFNEEPLKTIVPINFAAIGLKDPLEVLTTYEPSMEDIGAVCEALIGAVPGVGPVLGVVFSIFWGSSIDDGKVTKEDLEKKLSELKEDLIKIIDEKIEASEIKRQKQLCEDVFSGFKSSFDLLAEDMSFWYQYGFDTDYVTGTPATETDKATHSYREKSHINIFNGLRNIKLLEGETNGLDKLNTLLESDLELYPVPLYKAPVEVAYNNYVNDHDRAISFSSPVCNLTVSDKKGPYIYRVDAVNCSGEGIAEYRLGRQRYIPNREPISGCQGFCLLNTDARIKIVLDQPKTVRIRLLSVNSGGSSIGLSYNRSQTLYLTSQEEAGIVIRKDEESKCKQPRRQPMGPYDNIPPPQPDQSGFVQTDKLYDITSLDLQIVGCGKLLCIELIVYNDECEPQE